jgi:hypothetical protein
MVSGVVDTLPSVVQIMLRKHISVEPRRRVATKDRPPKANPLGSETFLLCKLFPVAARSRDLVSNAGRRIDAMPTFDIAELRREGFPVIPLPDENGRIIDTTMLPPPVTQRLITWGVDVSPSMRMIGAIAPSPTGGPGRYVIRFINP